MFKNLFGTYCNINNNKKRTIDTFFTRSVNINFYHFNANFFKVIFSQIKKKKSQPKWLK